MKSASILSIIGTLWHVEVVCYIVFADECGGVQISFPRAGVDSDRVILKGAHDCIEAAKQRMREIVKDLVSQQ